MTDPDYDVIVTGFGPVGETCANLLGYYGIKSLIIDKDQGVFPLPRAITWDKECERAISVCKFSNELDLRIIRAADHIDSNEKLIFRVQLVEKEKYKYFHSMSFMYQPEFDRVHRENALKYESNTIKEGWELIDYSQENGLITCSVKDVNNNEIKNITTKYLIGSDGASSSVRKISKIELQDYNCDQTWMVVDGYNDKQFECFEEVDAIQFCNPRRPITIIQGAKNRFRFEIGFIPGDKEEEIQKEEVFTKYVNRWIGDSNVTYDRKAVYSFHSASAKQWRKDNMFLLGDAAHQMPPFMGQGLNSGCRDAENLLWKINGVLNGTFDESILDTYESERKPHAERIMRAAINMGGIINAKSYIIAFLRNIFLRLATTLSGTGNLFPAFAGIRLGEGIHNMPVIKNPSIETYYFNNIDIKFKDGRNQDTDQLLKKNFGLILNNFSNNKSISESNIELLRKLNFKIINLTESYEDSNYEHYIHCKDLYNDFNTYCKKFNCDAVFLRPDRYVFDRINTQDQNLDAVISKVLNQLKEKIRIN